MSAKEELAALKREVEELKAKLAPPKPFVPEPYQRYDPTAGMCMPPSALAAMVNAVPDRVLRDIVRDNRGPSTPTGMIPRSQQPTGGGSANVPGGGTGWVDPAPLGPPPGLRYVDQQLDAQDAKDRAELIEREAKLKAMEKLAEANRERRRATTRAHLSAARQCPEAARDRRGRSGLGAQTETAGSFVAAKARCRDFARRRVGLLDRLHGAPP
jgi:hypothetical protein